MNKMNSIINIALLLTLILTIIAEIHAASIYQDIDRFVESPVGSIDRFDEVYYPSYRQPNAIPVDKLKRGYYYVDNGSLTPVSSPKATTQVAQRREDYSGDYKFSPVARFRQTHTKRERLFVPNFFG